jgi:2,4-dienoyl-CoA reductase-like NADH-dependent reductase (Old Yellow Enzyme family)/thioredoxin reductase
MLGLRNEFIMAPVKLGYSDGTGIVTKKHLDFYNERSKHIGAIALEPLYMDAGLRELPTQLGIDDDNKIMELKKITELLHNNGAKAIAHLNHPGRMANPKIPGNYHWSSTDKPCENGGAAPKRMDREMMDSVIAMHVAAAKRAVDAGFDIVELQFGHGYLMAQFLSPAVNDRTDEYGGALENRVKFPMELFNAVRNAVDVPLMVRVSGDEMTPDGFHVDEMMKFTVMLEKAGASAIHVVAGTACANPPWFFQHMFVPKGKTWELAGKLKQNLTIPVAFVGRINSFNDIKTIKEKYNGDIIALGRAMVADPDFVGKYLGKTEGLLRPCLACAEGCLGGVKSGKGLGCVVNPLVNTGLKKPEKADKSKKFAVVGGGLAGIEAAVTLSTRGHQVDLFEKNELGGQFNLAWLPPKKESLKELVDYYKGMIEKSDVTLHIKEFSTDNLKPDDYDGVILATGAVPAVPPIKGLKKFYWTEFLHDDQLPHNKKIVVIGGGLIGLEVASKLIENDNEVIVIEMLEEMARGMEMIEKAMTLKKMKEKGAVMLVNHRVSEVNGDKVVVESSEGNKVFDSIDHIVVATGMKSYIPFESDKTPVYTVGDAAKVGKAQEAIHDAYELAAGL